MVLPAFCLAFKPLHINGQTFCLNGVSSHHFFSSTELFNVEWWRVVDLILTSGRANQDKSYLTQEHPRLNLHTMWERNRMSLIKSNNNWKKMKVTMPWGQREIKAIILNHWVIHQHNTERVMLHSEHKIALFWWTSCCACFLLTWPEQKWNKLHGTISLVVTGVIIL